MPQRKPAPSPLQVSETTPASATASPNSASHTRSSRVGSGSHRSPQSPRSPRSRPSPDFDLPKSPRDRLDELIASESSANINPSNSIDNVTRARGDPPTGAGAKMQSYNQLRNVSSPLPHTGPATISPPPSPPETDVSTFPSAPKRPGDVRQFPRTSSIDSAISTVSSTTSQSHKSSTDSFAPNPQDLGSLINVAGSPETLIQHLLKEKSQSAAQNAQLWKLVEKQRTMILGLNADLQRAQEEREKYRQKLKELSQLQRGMASIPRPNTASPTPSDVPDDLPTQGERLVREPPGGSETSQSSPQSNNEPVKSSISSEGSENTAVDTLLKAQRSAASEATPKPAIERSTPAIAPLQTTGLGIKDRQGNTDSPSLSAPGSGANSAVSPGSFTAKRAQLQKSGQPPPFSFTEATPPASTVDKFPPFRKMPPAPLNLQPKKQEAEQKMTAEGHSGSEYEDDMEVDELPVFERGRKKTREEDDREREVIAIRQSRSNSTKLKPSKSRSNPDLKKAAQAQAATQQAPMPAVIKALSPEPSSGGSNSLLSAPMSLAGALSSPPSQIASNTKGAAVAAGPLSPGLPTSPRPGDRPINSPTPRMPRDGPSNIASPPMSARMGAFPGLPLSPRAPRQPIPQPLLSPASNASLVSPQSRSLDDSAPTQAVPSSPRLDQGGPHDTKPEFDSRSIKGHVPQSRHAGTIYTGLVSEAYPDLLLPPNALPSIIVKVVSSRLRPSRNSYLGPKDIQEEPVLTLGVFARSDMSQLWQIEKSVASLPSLDHQVKVSSKLSMKLPDRSLFVGHAPSKIDDRRAALEKYFETMLDTPMDEKSALAVCHYLSMQAIEPSSENAHKNISQNSSPTSDPSSGQTTKEGYLTKQGKKFGGWKARYFILNEPVLHYYEIQGGALLGTIKLHNAKIGKQSSNQNTSPSCEDNDSDNQYRHAFLILEPKRKDSSSHIRHVLCAESDAERDAWVKALMYYVGDSPTERQRPNLESLESSSKSVKKSIGRQDSSVNASPDSENFDSLQAVSYESTSAASKPVIQSESKSGDKLSPTMLATHSNAPHGQIAISGPVNGRQIENAELWGNKPQAAMQKEHKKSRLWGFRDRQDQDGSQPLDTGSGSTTAQYAPRQVASRPQFGIPLAEAVEHCSPRGEDICLPAVVFRCLEYLEYCNATKEEGIFRLSGSSTVIKALQYRFDTEGDFDIVAASRDGHQYHDVHAVASLLKQYLRELPASILTRELHLDFLKVLDIPDKSRKVQAYNVLVHRLPECNWALLRALSAFLVGVTNNHETNKMTPRNVGIVFSPTLKIPAPVLQTFLDDYNAIFGTEPPATVAEPVVPEVAVSEPLTPEDIRSPRKQMFTELPTPAYDQTSFPAPLHHHQQNHTYKNQQQERSPPSYEPQNLQKIPMQSSSSMNDMGFMPLQPSYEPPASSLNAALMAPNGINPPAAIPRQLTPNSAAKKGRRESSMMLMGGGGGGQRKSSILGLRDTESIDERGSGGYETNVS